MARTEKSLLITHGRALTDLGVAIIEAVERAGGTDEDARRIFKDKILRQRIGLLVMGKLKLEGSPCQKNAPHLIPDWVKEVVEDVEPTVTEGVKLSFPGFLRDKETSINGPTMRQRAVEMVANKGLSDVPALLGKDGKGLETIPAELRVKAYIVLSGTVLRSSRGILCVPYLDWSGGAWIVDFNRLDDDWCDDDRLVACE